VVGVVSVLQAEACVLVLVSMCVEVSVWLGWGGILVAGFSLQRGYHPNPATPKFQHTSKQEHTTSVVMDILMSETC